MPVNGVGAGYGYKVSLHEPPHNNKRLVDSKFSEHVVSVQHITDSHETSRFPSLRLPASRPFSAADSGSILSWAKDKGLSEVKSSEATYTWSLGKNMRLHTNRDTQSKKLVITAHGDYNEFKKTTLPVPNDTTLTFFGPHKKNLRDPALVNSLSDSRRYASVSAKGITPFTTQAKSLLVDGQIKDITGSQQFGMVANYKLYAFEQDDARTIEETISGNMDLNKLYSELTTEYRKLSPRPPEPHDILSLTEGSSASLENVIAALNDHQISYNEIKMCFCRGREGVIFLPDAVYPRNKTHET